MSTRATIAHADSDGGFHATYLHFDGYPEHAGVILNQRFNSLEKAMALVAGGELRSLSDGDEGPEYFANARPARYLSDRSSLLEFARQCDANYLYVFQDGQWHCQKR